MRKRNKRMKQLSSTELTIRQGERLARRLTDTLYSGRQDINGLVVMTYALAKTYMALKLTLKDHNIDAEPYFLKMAKWWEPIMKAEREHETIRPFDVEW